MAASRADRRKSKMKTLKAVGGALLAIVIMIASNILASLISSGIFLLNAPEWLAIAVMGILYIIITLVAVKLIYGKGFKYKFAELGMPKPAVKILSVILAVLLPAAVSGIFLLFVKGSFAASAMDSNTRASMLAEGIVYSSIGAAVVEEVLFRGVMMNLLKKRWNTAVGVIVPSVIFAAMHIMEMEEFKPLDVVQLLVAGTLVGIMFSLIAIRTGSVWNSAIVHAVWNLVMVGGILNIGGTASESALMNYVLDSKSFMLTGGAFGIESSVIAIIAYAIVIGVLLFAGRKKITDPANR